MTNRSKVHSRKIPAKAERVLLRAHELAATVKSWADFTNALFDPEQGFVARVYPSLSERQRFFKSKEFVAIDRLLLELMRRHGVADGATPKEWRPLVMHLPRTLRLNLEREAQREGVDLDQLVLTKLARPL